MFFCFSKIIRQKWVIALFVKPSVAFQTAIMWLFGLCPLITSLIYQSQRGAKNVRAVSLQLWQFGWKLCAVFSPRPAQTLLLSRFCAYVRACEPWGSLVSGGRASPSLLHLCALCDGSPGPAPPPSTAHSPLELQKPTPVNSSINNLCLSVSLPADCCLCACKIQLGCDGWGWGRGGWVQRGRRRGSADITACQGDISFAMNHGPEEDRGQRARQRDFFSFTPLKKNNNLHVYFCLFYFFFFESRETTENCVVLA